MNGTDLYIVFKAIIHNKINSAYKIYFFVKEDISYTNYALILNLLYKQEYINEDYIPIILTDLGNKKFKELELQIKQNSDKENIKLEKSKFEFEFELAKEKLNEFPKTKTITKIAYIIAIILAFALLIQWIIT